MPLFSVIIPVYNKASFIAETIASVIEQDFSDYEILIIDDGSTDGSADIIKGFTDHRIRYYRRANHGVAASRNFGIAESRSPYIAFLDADDRWKREYLSTQHKNIVAFPDQKVFAAAFEIETSRNVFAAHYSVKRSTIPIVVDFFEASRMEAVLWTSSAIFHRDVFADAGVFDERVSVAEDTDLWIRIGLRYKIVFEPTVLARYSYDPHSHSRHKPYSFDGHFFGKYQQEANSNAALRHFLDQNLFSAIIKSKLAGDRIELRRFQNVIDKRNLTLKKRMLILMPGPLLRLLIQMKQLLADIGLGRSIFK